jgi:UDP-N-acetylmuramyl pentapeptide phosphotransferase/UDP-N-acetylglucosamine-1-phosphate transferase
MDKGWAVAVVTVAVLGASVFLTGLVRRWLVLDRPVERSSHSVPVPRGAGLVLVPVLVAGAAALAILGLAPRATPVVLAAACGLALLSWRDDVGGLSVLVRLAGHAVAVAVGVAVLPDAAVFHGIFPPLLDRIAAGLAWLWFVNLYNFMDGIDGITGVETAALGVGIALVLALAASPADGTAALGLVAAAVGLGFLRWNWHPARIFLGDVGSVPLGYFLGWLLLLLAGKGLWAPALILPLYYLADATLTLARRIGRGERFWQAHHEHFYQRALGSRGDHAGVARIILAGDLALIVLALLAVAHPLAALAFACAVVAMLLFLLQRRASRGG